MRTGKLYIDGNDAYLRYGVYVVQGGYDELVAMPPLKEPQKNDWHEEDGIEVDLENPVLDAREVSVTFAVSGIFNRFADFVDLLSDRAYHVFEFTEIQRTFKLRLTSSPKSDNVRVLGIFSLKFFDDFPMQDYQYKEPQSDITKRDDFLIDGKDLTEYGVRVLKGTMMEVTKVPAVKLNLETKSSYSAGRTYDNSSVTFKSKEVKINCLLRAETLQQLWRNYDALLHDLTQPNERELYSKELEHFFMFYYKECKVTRFFPDGDIWLEFVLTITITGNLRLDGRDGFVLAAQNLDIIITEDGINAIDLAPDKNSYPSVRFVNNRSTLRFTGAGTLRFNN